MRVLVTGGTGFIGGPLVQKLLDAQHHVVIIAKHAPHPRFLGCVKFFPWDAIKEEPPPDAIEGIDVVFHLAGENIFGLWTEKRKKLIFDSRELGTRNLVSAIKKATIKPKVLISASALGYYGDKGEEEITEESLSGDDFLARVCKAWEREGRVAEAFGLRTVQIRTAPVLGHGGVLAKMLPAFKLGLGAVHGTGEQWFPWIHIADVVRIYLFAMENEKLIGPINACSPHPVRNKDFTKTLAQVLRRHAFLRIPSFVIRSIFGEISQVVLASQNTRPKKLLDCGFHFLFPNLLQALDNIISKENITSASNE